MSSYLDRLNLRPNERRLVVFVAVVVFAVLNIWMVWPHFGDLGRAQLRLDKARRTLEMFREEIKHLPEHQSRVQSFEKENPTAAQDEQSTEMLRVIQSKAAQSQVNITTTSRLTTKTNQFFLEQMATISVQAGEKQLVNFLYNLGTGESTIRVRELSLQPDGARQQLSGQIKLVASYQRKPAAKAGAPPAASPTPVAAKPAASPTAKPAAPPAAKPAAKPVPAVPVAAVKSRATTTPSPRPTPSSPRPATPTVPNAKKP